MVRSKFCESLIHQGHRISVIYQKAVTCQFARDVSVVRNILQKLEARRFLVIVEVVEIRPLV
jgi:hypothetical protein